MPKLSPEMANARREEIIAACETLYEKMGFKDLTLKEIAKYTSLSRPSIYNYALNREIEEHETMSKDMVAEVIARTLCDHPQILKIVSMNHYDMEANSRVERLIEFKKSYGATLKAVDRLLIKFCKDMTAQDRQAFLYSFFPFIYGIYPYTVVTDKQKRAMEQAIVPYVYYSAYDLTYQFVKKLLG